MDALVAIFMKPSCVEERAEWSVSGVSDSPRHCDLFRCQEASMA